MNAPESNEQKRRVEYDWAADMRRFSEQLAKGEMTLEAAEAQANLCGKAAKMLALAWSKETYDAKWAAKPKGTAHVVA